MNKNNPNPNSNSKSKGSLWTKKIQQAQKFLQPAHTHGRDVYARYEDKREDALASSGAKRVNLFYANVNTLKESLFSSLPKPDVSRMHRGDFEDDVSRVAALIMQRVLHYEVQCDNGFTESTDSVILERLVPGIGQAWVRFNADETMTIEHVFWEDFIYEPARCWSKVGWVGRKLAMTKEQVTNRWGEDACSKLETIKNEDNTPKEIDENKYAVYEIWNKRTRTVIHTAIGLDEPLDEKPDPYKLKNFYPCPEPLIANPTTNAFLPVTDYHIAQDQYIQLDVLYGRISLIITAVKVAGCYDASEPAIGKMLEGQENKLIPVDNWAMYAEKGGSRGMIDWYPVDTVVAVLQQLQASFDAIKTLLYEVTGMADILRGSTNQYETAQAQQMKAQFAGVRMTGDQRTVSEFVEELLNIMGGIVCNLYSDVTILEMAGGFLPADEQLVPSALELLRDGPLRGYKISIEADSLTQADWAMEKSQRMELMGYVSQYLQSAVVAAQQFPEMGPLLMGMLKFGLAGYKGASEVEGLIDQAIAQAANAPETPEEPTPEQQKMQAEQQKMQAEQQMQAQKFQMEMTLKKSESENRMRLEELQARADMAVEQQKLEHQREMYEMDLRMKTIEFEMEKRKMGLEVEKSAITAEIDIEKKNAEGRNADV